MRRLISVTRRASAVHTTKLPDRVSLPTGIGMAVRFLGRPTAPLELAAFVHRQ